MCAPYTSKVLHFRFDRAQLFFPDRSPKQQSKGRRLAVPRQRVLSPWLASSSTSSRCKSLRILGSEISFDNLRIIEHAVRRSTAHNCPVVQHNDALGQSTNNAHKMLN